MRRDWNKVRAVLLAMQGLPLGRSLAPEDVPGMDIREARAYFALLTEAGLVKGDPTAYPDTLKSMTWAGHDLADILRKQGFFERIVEEAKLRGVALTLDAIAQIARALIGAA